MVVVLGGMAIPQALWVAVAYNDALSKPMPTNTMPIFQSHGATMRAIA